MKSDVIIGGAAAGTAIVSQIPLSFWGGVDQHSGMVIDNHHDLMGQCITGKVLCIPYDRGSCSGSGIMLEMIRAGTAPAAILCLEAEPVLALGSVMGEQIYQRKVVIHTVSADDYAQIQSGDEITIDADGVLTVCGKEST